MHFHSDISLFTPPTTLQSTPAPPTTSPPTSTQKEIDKKDSGSPNQIQDVVELSGHDPELAKLKARDREVRAHEAAHAAAAGSLTSGGPSFTYQRGSDGRLYAVGGEVNIDTSAVQGDPEATIRKARQIRAAANAPANPSAQDRTIAAQATRMEAQARRELQQERTEAIQSATAQGSPTPPFGSTVPAVDLFA